MVTLAKFEYSLFKLFWPPPPPKKKVTKERFSGADIGNVSK